MSFAGSFERVARSPWAWALGASAFALGGLALLARASGPAASVASSGISVVSARPLPLTPGTTYYGRASLGWATALFVTADAVSAKLAALGFTNILVTTDASALPASWPVSERDGNLFVEATYSGKATTMAIPTQVQKVWTA